ncbi:MAG: MBL fold metallo-hydrolase [Oscillospiraceae bacterium]|nr:MBL fold metallo-hydrolase [Oscillospiraceae bacterium]
MKRKLKNKLKTAAYMFIVGVVGYVLVQLGIVDAATTRWSDGYPVTIQKAGDTVSVISTGQADSALISSGGKFCLIDVGQTYGGHIGVTEYLQYAGVKEIELLVITHFHYDHTSELLDVMDNFKINNIVIPNLSQQNVPTADYFSVFLDKAERKNINLKPAVKGDEYTVGNGTLKILADTYNDLSENDTSVATLFVQGDFTYLSTGDGEAEYEKRLLEDFSDTVTVFAAGHHGSGDSNTELFIKTVRPQFVAISAGKDNDYGHPHRRVTELLESMNIPYRITAQHGTIVYSITENKLLENKIL